MVAFILVAIACTVLMVNATRSNARDLIRNDGPSLVAGGASTPPSTPEPSLATPVDEPVIPVAGRTLTKRTAPKATAEVAVTAPSEAVPTVGTGSATVGTHSKSRPGKPDRAGERGPTTAWIRAHHPGGRHEYAGPRGQWWSGSWPSGQWKPGSDHDADDDSRRD